MNEKYRNIEDIYDNYNDITPQYDEKESFKEDTDLDETLPETFEGKIDFLAADEEEAIEGYDKVLLALTDKKYEHIRKQLEIIRDEEVAHKEFLEKAINDLKAIYVDPSENREEYSDKLTEKDDNKVKKLRVVEKVLERTLSRSYLNKDGYFEHFSGEKDPAIKEKCQFFTLAEAKQKVKELQGQYPDDIILPYYTGQVTIFTEDIEDTLILKEKKISKSPIHSYIYKGPIYKNGFLCSEYWEGETQAVSEAQALNNLRFQAGKYLGYNVGSHRVKMYLKPENLYKLENIDDYYDSYEDIEPIKQCDKCGALLSDNGNCPVCDDGEEDYK